MAYNPNSIKKKGETSVNKSLYISSEMVRAIEAIAGERHTSFNSVVISMIEYCLSDLQED